MHKDLGLETYDLGLQDVGLRLGLKILVLTTSLSRASKIDCRFVTILSDLFAPFRLSYVVQEAQLSQRDKGGGALCAGNAVALLVFGPVMP